ncbi:hypothetical protein NDU88_007662 [Pleurodeles waltl]|uniref:Uncharacterized protein n=1 Tax=Pleurodeles waltl TaxID=8319 RepID=A0AAV7RQ35_PLEWA|nr:hypothetical protein NDU88_007662 [Pleurodeles waltl]
MYGSEGLTDLLANSLQAVTNSSRFARRSGFLFASAWHLEAGELVGRVRWQRRAAWGCGQLEQRVRPGAARLTSGDASGPGFGILEVYPVVEGEPSTTWGAGFVELGEDIEEELLDYEDEEEAEEVERGHRRSVQKGCTLDVLHETTNNAVRSVRRVGGDHQMFDAGNLPRVAKIPWAGTRSRCTEDSGPWGVVGDRRVRMLELVQKSIAPSPKRSYDKA